MVVYVLRHILLIRLKQGVTTEQVDAFAQAIASLPFPGRRNIVVGRDIRVRPGNMDLAVSNDFPDEATYRAWGEDLEHAKVRSELLAPIAERIERCLFYSTYDGQPCGQLNPRPRSSLLGDRLQCRIASQRQAPASGSSTNLVIAGCPPSWSP